MKWNEVFCHTFKELEKTIAPMVKHQVDMMLPSMPMPPRRTISSSSTMPSWSASATTSTSRAMGVSVIAKKLPPEAVKYVCEDYCIDLPAHLQDQEALAKAPEYLRKAIYSNF